MTEEEFTKKVTKEEFTKKVTKLTKKNISTLRIIDLVVRLGCSLIY